jgi:hypothetical protein
VSAKPTRGLLGEAGNFMAALWSGLVALVKAYDDEVSTDPSGYPLLAEWGSEQGNNGSPYQVLLAGAERARGEGPICAALVFVQGRGLGEVQYLRPGTYTLGATCSSDIAVHSTAPSEAKMKLIVTRQGTVVSSDSGATPVEINGHVSQFEGLVDQDECVFNKSSFYYIALPLGAKRAGS